MLQAIKKRLRNIVDITSMQPQPSPPTLEEIQAQTPPPPPKPEEVVTRYLQTTPSGARGLNLGCGGMTFKEWLNIDEQYPHHVNILWDLRQKLPFIPDGIFDAVYSEHFFEHINRKTALELTRECFRALKTGGHIRIAMPDLDMVLNNYHDDVKYRDVHGQFAEFFGVLFYTRGE